MTFLNPALLYGLPFVSIPLLIHLFSKSKKEYIEFSSLKFLKILEMKRLKQLRLKQILLLIMRTLIILFIVMGFARPTIKGTIGTPLNTKTTISAAFVLDNSFSSRQPFEGGELFSYLKNMTISAVRQFSLKDNLFLVSADDPDNPAGPVTVPRDMVTLLDKQQSVSKKGNLHSAILQGIALVAETESPVKELYIVSDFQKTELREYSILVDSLKHHPEITCYLLSPDIKDAVNLSIRGVGQLSRLYRTKSEIMFRITPVNYSAVPVRDIKLNFYKSGERIADAVMSFEPGQTGIKDFSCYIARPGYIDGYFEVEDEHFPLDNKNFFTLYVPETIKILTVEGSPDPFLKTNLSLDKNGKSDLKNTFVDYRNAYSEKFENHDIVIIDGIRTFSENDGLRLKNYLDWGGNIILALSSQTDLATYNDYIAKELNLPPALAQRTFDRESGGFIRFGRIVKEHPVLSGIFGETERSVSMPKIYSYIKLKTVEGSDPLISLADGSPYMAEMKSGNGNVVILCSGFQPEESDIQLKGMFVPMLQNLLRYLAVPEYNFKNRFYTGSVLSYVYRGTAREFEIITPDKQTVKILPKIVSGAYNLQFAGLNSPGIYQLFGDGEPVQKFAVNIDPEESDIRRFGSDELKDIFSGIDTEVIESPEMIEEILTEARYGTELSAYAFLLAVLLAVSEMVLANELFEKKIRNIIKRPGRNI